MITTTITSSLKMNLAEDQPPTFVKQRSFKELVRYLKYYKRVDIMTFQADSNRDELHNLSPMILNSLISTYLRKHPNQQKKFLS